MNFEEKLQDIRTNPDKHKHWHYVELITCCSSDGIINTALMTAHEGLLGHNGGVKCDVRSGPCSCGAWH